jgi:hypothetical protein
MYKNGFAFYSFITGNYGGHMKAFPNQKQMQYAPCIIYVFL